MKNTTKQKKTLKSSGEVFFIFDMNTSHTSNVSLHNRREKNTIIFLWTYSGAVFQLFNIPSSVVKRNLKQNYMFFF